MAEVPTARGDFIDSGELGFTSVVEKCAMLVDPDIHRNWPDTVGATRAEIVDIVVEALASAARAGYQTIVDRTLPGIGRDVPLLREIAERSPVNIVVSTGYYTWDQIPLYFWFREQSGQGHSFEYFFERDIEEGIGDTGVRAGMLKVVTDRFGLTAGVERLLRATARVHRRTGVPIGTHTEGGMNGPQQLAILLEEGVDPSRVVVGHVDKDPAPEQIEVAQRIIDHGANVCCDAISHDLVDIESGAGEMWVERVTELCARGHADRVFLGANACAYQTLAPGPGTSAQQMRDPWPRLTEVYLPRLLARGVTADQIEQMTIHNPRRLFETRALGPY